MSGFLFLLLFIASYEFLRAKTNLSALAYSLVAIVLVGALALSRDLDLLGASLLAIYSSVFVFLSLLALYFARPLTALGKHSPLPLALSCLLVAGALLYFVGLEYHNPLTSFN